MQQLYSTYNMFGHFQPIWWTRWICSWFQSIAIFAERYFCLKCNFSQIYKLALPISTKDFHQMYLKNWIKCTKSKLSPLYMQLLSQKIPLMYFKFILAKLKHYVKHIFTFCRPYRFPSNFPGILLLLANLESILVYFKHL